MSLYTIVLCKMACYCKRAARKSAKTVGKDSGCESGAYIVSVDRKTTVYLIVKSCFSKKKLFVSFRCFTLVGRIWQQLIDCQLYSRKGTNIGKQVAKRYPTANTFPYNCTLYTYLLALNEYTL